MTGPRFEHASAFALAIVLSLILTPLSIRLAWRVAWLDHPEARKLHTSATALLGGAGVLFAAGAAWVVLDAFGPVRLAPLPLPLLCGLALAFVVGLWDDRFGLGPLPKLVTQILCAALLIASIGAPDLGLPWLVSAGLSLFVIVAVMNACNFLDNMNGMLGGIAALTLAGFAAIEIAAGRAEFAPAQLALAGACAGFLPWNYPKARTFLGDAGSLVLGYSLAASLLLALRSSPRGWSLLGPPLLLAYPAFDMIFVVIRRRREGRPIEQGGRDHTNHRLASLIQCPKRTVLLIWCSTAALCVSGFALSRVARPIPALLLWGLWTLLFLLTGRRLSSVPVPPKASPASPIAAR